MEWLSIRKPLDEQEVRAILREEGVSLPEDYVKQIGPINGGALKAAYVQVKGVGDIAYSRNTNLCKDVNGNAFHVFDRASGLFPVVTVGNGDYFCIELGTGKIVYYQHEIDRKVPVCENFSKLLSMIQQE